jgi:ATP/maltotriose-dependent transcriptional regulator MalT
MSRDELERGREAYARRAWGEACESLARADAAEPMGPDDLELLATAAYMVGRDDVQLASLERAHRGHVDRGDGPRAIRCAFWLGVHLFLLGEVARASGWFGRSRRLLEQEERDCAERGHLLIADGFQQAAAGEWEASFESAAAATEIGQRFGDAEVLAVGLMDEGHALIRLGRIEEGLARLDQAMVEASAHELSPVVMGLVYCSVIDDCQEAREPRRAHEWTAAMTEWCEAQEGVVPFTGICLIHRAELQQLRGEWAAALEESRLASKRFALKSKSTTAGHALYREGEILRLQGDLAGAEEAYRQASLRGSEPQPGLALLRLAQGRRDAAAAAIEQVLAGTTAWLERARFLPAAVEIALDAGDSDRALAASEELEQIAARHGSAMLRAQSAQARGAVELAGDHCREALLPLRQAWRLWQELDVPYEAALVRVLVATACRSIGDHETAALELDAARTVFEQLGALPDLARIGEEPAPDKGLSPRELQVLRLLAAGESNKAIAAELVLSKRTVDRHVSNIFTKIHVSSRAAATAYAYEHELI